MREKILWIAGGLVFVALAFFIPEQADSIWPSVVSGTVAAFVFVIAFAWRWVREIPSATKRKSIYSVLAVFVTGISVFGFYQYKISIYQGEALEVSRVNMDRARARAFIHEPLLKTLRGYYRKKENSKGIGEVFRSRFDTLITSDSVYQYPHYQKKNPLKIYVSELTADRVVLVAEARSAEGYEKYFKNISGNKGNYQISATLTKEGVRYEREN